MPVLKVTHNHVTRRLPFQTLESLAGLRSFIEKRFSITSDTVITYKDEDGDDVTFSSEEEFRSVVAQSSNVLRLKLIDPVATDSMQVDALVSQVSTLLDSIRSEQSDKTPEVSNVASRKLKVRPAKGPSPPTFSRDLGVSKEANTKPKQKNNAFTLRRFFSLFPPNRFVNKNIKSMQKKTRILFNKTSEIISTTEEKAIIIKALQGCTDDLREFLGVSAGRDSAVPDALETFINKIKGKLGCNNEAVLDSMTTLVRAAVQDDAFIVCLSTVMKSEKMPWEEGPAEASDGNQHFITHKVKCNNCKIMPIVGTRYRCTTDKKDNLCSNCFTPTNKKDKQYEELHYPWESVVGNAMVPPAPLTMADRGVMVKFLHFILLDLGYMNKRMLEKRPGAFVLNTKRAVGVFQQEHAIDGGGVYDQRTAKMLEGVIARRNGEKGEGNAGDRITPMVTA